MAKVKYICQGIDKKINHAGTLKSLIKKYEGSITKIILSIAFIRQDGVKILFDILNKINVKVEVYIGIRNGITSIQALFSLLHKKIKIYAIDTATSAIIYHPKIYGILCSN